MAEGQSDNDVRQTQPLLLVLKTEEGPRVKEHSQPPEAGKGKEVDSPI